MQAVSLFPLTRSIFGAGSTFQVDFAYLVPNSSPNHIELPPPLTPAAPTAAAAAAAMLNIQQALLDK